MDQEIKAVILDMDGVITRTAQLHARAWKQMFDRYNQRRMQSGKPGYKEFTIADDYPEYLDGVPRYDGVKAFLSSRGVELPYGNIDDGANKETICGLGNWKNELFHELLINQRVEISPDAVEKVKAWRSKGVKTAAISSSKNSRMILESAGIDYLFDCLVDGVAAMRRNLEGKPNPDILLEAAKELDVEPGETAILEDSLAGVKAGLKGGFKLVVGVARTGSGKRLTASGAHIVVNSLDELEV